jgi:hypothetical protein
VAEGTTASRLRIVAIVVALVLAVGSAVWAGSGIAEREDAATQLTRDRAALQSWRVAARQSADRAVAARATAANLGPQLNDVSSLAATVAQLDEQELALLREAIAAFPGTNVGAFNRDVSGRNALDAEHDVAVQSLRAKIDALIAALEDLETGQVVAPSGPAA